MSQLHKEFEGIVSEKGAANVRLEDFIDKADTIEKLDGDKHKQRNERIKEDVVNHLKQAERIKCQEISEYNYNTK